MRSAHKPIGTRRLYTTGEVAKQLDIQPPALRAHIHTGALSVPALSVGPAYLWSWDEVQAARKELSRPGRRKPRRQHHAEQRAGGSD